MNEMIETIEKIVTQMEEICETLQLHNKVLQMLLKDSIEKEKDKGMFSEMDRDIQEFWRNLGCYRRNDD